MIATNGKPPIPENLIPKRDKFTNSIRTKNWTDHLSAIPWVAVLGKSGSVQCHASTQRGSQCRSKAQFLYVDVDDNVRRLCKVHTQSRLNDYRYEYERLMEWEQRVSFETDRYTTEEKA